MWASGAYGHFSDYLLWWIVAVSLLIHTWCFFKFFPRRPRKTRLVLGNILVFITMLSLAGLMAESYVRFLVVETDTFGASLVSRRWFLIYPQLNSLYCRDKEWSEGPRKGITRIAFIGDSFTYGWGINSAADRFTDRLQSNFDQREPGKVEVMNVAWSGWGASDYVNAAHDMIQDYAVNEIVLCHVPNDIESLLPVTPDFDPKLAPKSRYVNTDSSFLLNYLFHRVVAPRRASASGYWDWLADGYENPAIWGKQEAHFHKILELAAAGGVRVRVVLLPFIRTGAGRFDQPAIHAKVRAFFEDRGVHVIDLLPVLGGIDQNKLVVNSYDPHPNDAANRMFAQAIWDGFYAMKEIVTGSVDRP